MRRQRIKLKFPVVDFIDNGVKQNLEKIYGPTGRGEYAVGSQVTFLEEGVQITGEVLHVTAPGTTVTGRQLPTTYEVDCGDGWPHTVLSNQIVQQ